MKFNIKKIMAVLGILSGMAVYPLMSLGSSNTQKNTLEFNNKNVVSLRGEVNAQSVAATISALRELDSAKFTGGKPIYLFLYTPGGEIQPGLELIEATHGFKRPIQTVTMFAASMGFQIAQGLGERYILKNGILMSHRAAGGFEGSFGGTSPSQIDSRYNFWLRRIQELDEQTVSRTNGKQTLDSYRKQYSNELWLTGIQAVEQGYADSVVSAHCDSSLNGTDSHTTQILGIDVSYETSKCPMITGATNIKLSQSNGKEAINPATAESIKAKFLEQFEVEKNMR
jgi:ATP-dependent protease ClpP protease subunit